MNQLLYQSSTIPAIRTTLKMRWPSYKLKEQILQKMIRVWERFPNEFDESLLKNAELLFVLTSDEFKEQRQQKHLIRLIFSLFFIQKNLRKFVTIFGEKRHLLFRQIPTTLKFPFGSKPVLGLIVGICLFDKQETIEEKHLLLAAQKFLPGLQIVKGSVLMHHNPEDSIRLIYVEFEKKGGGSFSCEEISILKKGFSAELQARVEKNIPALFMVRNEEEVMKNILILSRELDFSHEIPETIINFEQQMPEALSFTIVLVRALKEDSIPIEDLFQNLGSEIRFYLDRNQIIGYLNDKYPKEATVFRLEIPIEENFLRSDFSINFYLARQKIKSLILQTLGPVRDFNGGMILKQRELLSKLKSAFKDISEQDPLLIENFFYALSPIEKQTTLPFQTLCRFFQLFVETIKETPSYEEPAFNLKILEVEGNLYGIVKSEDFSLFKILEKTTSFIHSKELLVSFKLNLQSFIATGFILDKEKHSEKVNHFLNKINEGIYTWKTEIQNRQVARLAIWLLPISFDPRVGGDENTRILLKMLFEGLMRLGKDGKPTYALAESVALLQDKKTYIFRLRPSFWSDGSKVVAYDFEYAWKKILSPEFHTQFASIFYPIKNAKFVKEGSKPLEEVGIKALNDNTLEVVLEHPVSYFLELVVHPLFSPISHKVDLIHPDWAFQEGDAYVCNGPFCLKRKNANYGYEFVKNQKYWDTASVSLDQIFIRKVKDSSIFEMFEKGAIDWIGRLMPFWDPTYAHRFSNKVLSLPSPKVSWCVFNTQSAPLNNKKIRKALSYSINKEMIVSLLNYDDAVPANTPIPLSLSMQYNATEKVYHPESAKQLFEEGLKEEGIKKNEFPVLTLLFPSVPYEKIALLIQQQWKEVFGISSKLTFFEWPEMFQKICQGDYQICLFTWTSWFNDPIYTLNTFKYRSEQINFSKWENTDYQLLLDLANQEEDTSKRLEYLKKAETILTDEMPVNPLFFEKSQCISKDHFHVICDSVYGYPDFKWAYIDRKIIQ